MSFQFVIIHGKDAVINHICNFLNVKEILMFTCSSKSLSQLKLSKNNIDISSMDPTNEILRNRDMSFEDFRSEMFKYVMSNLSFVEDEPNILRIEKHLESESFDEFDDFNPRHPQPKDKTHRRGGSYFNSDISDTVEQLRVSEDALNLSQIALHALELNNTD